MLSGLVLVFTFLIDQPFLLVFSVSQLMYKYNFNQIAKTGVVVMPESALQLAEELKKAIEAGTGKAHH